MTIIDDKILKEVFQSWNMEQVQLENSKRRKDERGKKAM
jgi:hypothetical protein